MKPTNYFSFIQIFMVLTLVFSMLAPSVCSLIDIELTSVVMKGFAEEESQNKSENEKSEKDIFLHYLSDMKSSSHYLISIKFGDASENDSTFTSEIVLPPPEHQI